METWIYGPRGNGKTELITWFERQISELETPIDLITLDPNDLAERQGLIDSVSQQLATRRGNWNFLENVQFDANIQLPGVGGVGITHGPRFSSRNLVAVMTASRRPILMTLDEAHTASPAVLKNLLDALQLAGKMIPAGLVLAGTPGLQDTLQATGTSYWSRGQMLAIGRLEPDSAAAVLAKPLLNAGFVTKSKAIERLVHVVNRYPYFLQLYGRSAFSAVLDGKRRCLGTKECDQAIRDAQADRIGYYKIRLREFEDAGEEVLARNVALAFRAHDNRLTNTQLNAVLDRMDPARRMDRKQFLRHKGYIWQQPSQTLWEPGIPSLMDFMIEQTETGSTNTNGTFSGGDLHDTKRTDRT